MIGGMYPAPHHIAPPGPPPTNSPGGLGPTVSWVGWGGVVRVQTRSVGTPVLGGCRGVMPPSPPPMRPEMYATTLIITWSETDRSNSANRCSGNYLTPARR